jgi:hypothetical protein
MQLVAKAKLILRAEGRELTKATASVRDVDGEDHHVLSWRLESKKVRVLGSPSAASSSDDNCAGTGRR